ncbi:MAG: 30S ribosomal protein S11, partial [Candidatus Omnitrophica bacterium]|nr:30S ribosomal protein S11 [Candidatus Omnitrophota bacterium]
MAERKKTEKRKKIQFTSDIAVAHIKATFNNTIITITDTKGNTL